MLEVFNKVICFLIMFVTGFFVIRKIIDGNYKISKKAYLYILLLGIIAIFLYPVQYTAIYTITIFLLNIAVYRSIFKIDLGQAIIATSLFMLALTASDMLVTTIFRNFWTQEQIRTNFYISIVANLSIGLISVLLLEIKSLRQLLNKFYQNISQKKLLTDIIFFVLLIFGLVQLLYNYAVIPEINTSYIANIVIVIIFTILTIIFIQNKNNYKTLSDEYDSLFSYVQNFEDWIEKEQLNKHEYKNQLAVLRTLSTEEKVKNRIDEILEDSINVEGEVANKLKGLPKGGIKGLVYYKVALAQKKKINLFVDISLKRKNYLSKLSEHQNKIICKLIGIYFDNSIEAALETKEKYVLLEIYELSDVVNIVLSNSFIKSKDFDKRNEKGVTTKGVGHGSGLYYAQNILSKNKWINSKQEVIDEYYIQTLSIKKLD